MPDLESEQIRDPLTQTSQRTPRTTQSTVAPTRAVELVSTQGKTTIADSVVAKIVGIAAREVEGVHDLVTSGAGAAISGLATRMTGGDQRSQGVNVEVGEREAAVDLNIVVDYGVSIPQVAEAVRRNIISRVAAMTGLVVKEVNIAVTDLYFPQDQALKQQQSRVQ